MNTFLGTGLKFPLEASEGGSLQLVSGSEKLLQSVADICNTQRGTVFYNLDAGWQKEELIFLAETTVLYELIALFLAEAIEEQEPRVLVEDILVEKQANETMVTVMFGPKTTNEIFYYVFPFYRNE